MLDNKVFMKKRKQSLIAFIQIVAFQCLAQGGEKVAIILPKVNFFFFLKNRHTNFHGTIPIL